MLQKLNRSLQRHLFGRDPHYHDPYEDPAEQYYARIYLQYLFQKMDLGMRHQRLKILDVGCHTGRLLVPLARAGHELTGIDSSRFHIKRTEKHLEEVGAKAQLIAGDGFQRLSRFAPESFDVAMCTEVLYQRSDFHEDLKSLLRLVRKGGLLATSHRSRFFYLSRAIREKDFETARYLVEHSEGALRGSYFNWQTPEELRKIYQDLGLENVLIRPVGIFSGNGGDGMAALCNLAELSNREREELFEVESHDSGEFAVTARYLLAIGQKNGAFS